jgi:hypothetical protein
MNNFEDLDAIDVEVIQRLSRSIVRREQRIEADGTQKGTEWARYHADAYELQELEDDVESMGIATVAATSGFHSHSSEVMPVPYLGGSPDSFEELRFMTHFIQAALAVWSRVKHRFEVAFNN